MTEQESLYSAILEEPADDLRRGVYADWLDENGQPERAEFIRVQVELAKWTCDFKQTPEQPGWRHDCGTDDNGYWLCQPLRSRELALLDAHWSRWIRESGMVPEGWKLSTDGDLFHVWRDTPFGDGFRFLFRRGFVDEVGLSLAAYLGGPCPDERHGDPGWQHSRCGNCLGACTTPGLAAALFAAHPIQVVRPTDVIPDLGDPTWWGPQHKLPYTWCSAADSDSRANLPRPVFDRLEPYPAGNLTTKGGVVAWYPSEQAAWDYLSDVLVAIGRERARVVATVAT